MFGSFSSLHQIASEAVIGLHGKVKPQWRLGHRRHILETGLGKGTEHHGGTRCVGPSRRGQLSFRIGQLLAAGGAKRIGQAWSFPNKVTRVSSFETSTRTCGLSRMRGKASLFHRKVNSSATPPLMYPQPRERIFGFASGEDQSK